MGHRLLLFLLAVLVMSCSGKQARESGSSTMSETEYADAMEKEHGSDSTKASGATEGAGGVETSGQMFTFGTVDGEEVRGYLAEPTSKGSYPAIIVIHEWWGLNDNIKAMTDKLAAQGYRALAIDLYDGKVADTPEAAKAAMMAVKEDRAKRVISAAGAFFEDAPSLGVIGWCFGGAWALQTGLLLGDELDAAVMYYGRPKTTVAEIEPLKAPLLGIFGADDEGIPVSQVREFEAALKEAGKVATIEIYPDAGHAFANPTGDRYQKAAAEDAWAKTLAFFERYLNG